MEDCIRTIGSYIHKGDWKNFIFTCKSFYSINSKEEVLRRRHLFFTLLKQDYYSLSDSGMLYTIDELKHIYIFKILKKFKFKCELDHVRFNNHLFIYSDLPRSQIVNIVNTYSTYPLNTAIQP